MALSFVRLTTDAMLSCMTHALSTESQEVMGLLLGRWVNEDDAAGAEVTHVIVLTRTDKRKDRVEVGYAQLASAAERAEMIGQREGRQCCVIGWYHSHPHITVLPSHVDVQTQGQYQAMDERFVGLIFAVFPDAAYAPSSGPSAATSGSSIGGAPAARIQVTAFQSRDVATEPGGFAGSAVPTAPAPKPAPREPPPTKTDDAPVVHMGTIVGSPADSADAPLDLASGAPANQPPAAAAPPPPPPPPAARARAPVWQCKPVPLQIVASETLRAPDSSEGARTAGTAEHDCCARCPATSADALRTVVSLNDVLLAEERSAFLSAALEGSPGEHEGLASGQVPGRRALPSPDARRRRYASAVYEKALVTQFDVLTLPTAHALRAHHATARLRFEALRARNQALRERLAAAGVAQQQLPPTPSLAPTDVPSEGVPPSRAVLYRHALTAAHAGSTLLLAAAGLPSTPRHFSVRSNATPQQSGSAWTLRWGPSSEEAESEFPLVAIIARTPSAEDVAGSSAAQNNGANGNQGGKRLALTFVTLQAPSGPAPSISPSPAADNKGLAAYRPRPCRIAALCPDEATFDRWYVTVLTR